MEYGVILGILRPRTRKEAEACSNRKKKAGGRNQISAGGGGGGGCDADFLLPSREELEDRCLRLDRRFGEVIRVAFCIFLAIHWIAVVSVYV